MKKLKAFTLIELLIGMLVSSIVIGFGYEAYSLIYKQFLVYKKTKQELMQATVFRSVLSNDFFESNQVYMQENKVIIQGEKSRLLYEFDSTYVLRITNEVTDTFEINVSNPVFSYAIENTEKSGLINGISFKSKIVEQEHIFYFKKEYSALELMTESNQKLE